MAGSTTPDYSIARSASDEAFQTFSVTTISGLLRCTRNDENDDCPHRYADRTARNPDVVAACRDDRCNRENSRFPISGNDLRNRRHGWIADMDRTRERDP